VGLIALELENLRQIASELPDDAPAQAVVQADGDRRAAGCQPQCVELL
jgi:hypothetical protein